MELLKQYKNEIDIMLEKYFDTKLAEAINSEAKEMIEFIKEYTLRGGKRIRAALVFYGYKLFRDDNLEEVKKASMALELIQSYLLIHDDIMDKDSLRRGGPTMHIRYEKIHDDKKYLLGKKHFGASMAILAGDLCMHFANEIICDLCLPDANKLQALKEINSKIPLVIHGQNLDILSSYSPDISEFQIYQIQMLKTAVYTFELPLILGGVLAGADSDNLTVLSSYSMPLGQAFQMQDDVLGLFGNETKLGKSIGLDIVEGKRTLLVSRALAYGNEDQIKIIKNLLGKQQISADEISQFNQIIIDTGALDYVKNQAQDFIEKSRDSLQDFPENEAKEFLKSITDYMVERKY